MEDGNVMINIIYEDNHLLIVEKPINILVQADDTKDEDLHTHYGICIDDKQACFTLQRRIEDNQELLEAGRAMGVTLGVGLHQEFLNDVNAANG